MTSCQKKHVKTVLIQRALWWCEVFEGNKTNQSSRKAFFFKKKTKNREFFANSRSQMYSPVAHFLFPSLYPSCSTKCEACIWSFILPKTLQCLPSIYWFWKSSRPGIYPLPSSPGSSFPTHPVIPENPNCFLSPHTLCFLPGLCLVCATFLFQIGLLDLENSSDQPFIGCLIFVHCFNFSEPWFPHL